MFKTDYLLQFIIINVIVITPENSVRSCVYLIYVFNTCLTIMIML